MAMGDDDTRPNSLLSEEQRQILCAMAARIFPETETPGALEIGAVDYIEIALAGDYAALVPLYQQGLRALQRFSRGKFNKRFFDLGDAEKDRVLSEFEAGAVDKFKLAAEFFEAVRYHVLEGVFCEPQYGGNKNMAGWRLVDFPGQQHGYGDAYIDKRVDVAPLSVNYPRPEKQ